MLFHSASLSDNLTSAPAVVHATWRLTRANGFKALFERAAFSNRGKSPAPTRIPFAFSRSKKKYPDRMKGPPTKADGRSRAMLVATVKWPNANRCGGQDFVVMAGSMGIVVGIRHHCAAEKAVKLKCPLVPSPPQVARVCKKAILSPDQDAVRTDDRLCRCAE